MQIFQDAEHREAAHHASYYSPHGWLLLTICAIIIALREWFFSYWRFTPVILLVLASVIAIKTARRALLYARRHAFVPARGTLVDCNISNLVILYPKLKRLRYRYAFGGAEHSSTKIAPYFNLHSHLAAKVHARDLVPQPGMELDVLINKNKPQEAYLEMDRMLPDMAWGAISVCALLLVAWLKWSAW